MNNYHLTIDNSLMGGSDYWDAQAAADSIEMKYSEYFKWEGEAQASLSRINAIGYAEKEMRKYPLMCVSIYSGQYTMRNLGNINTRGG